MLKVDFHVDARRISALIKEGLTIMSHRHRIQSPSALEPKACHLSCADQVVRIASAFSAGLLPFY